MATEELQTTRRPEIPEDVQAAMEYMLDYFWQEREMYAEEPVAGVYSHMLVINKWLDMFDCDKDGMRFSSTRLWPLGQR